MNARVTVQTTVPKFQVMPPLSAEQYDALKASIAEAGKIHVPVELDADGNILDGHNRVAICAELGIKNYPTITRHEFESDEEKRAFARDININRRHLNKATRDKLIADQLKDTPNISDRALAARMGVDHKTVGKHRKALVGRGEIPHTETMVDSLGRKQKRTKAPTYIDNSPEGRNATIERAVQIKKENKNVRGIGTRSSSAEERGLDFYPTPVCATKTLLALEDFQQTILEPSCGKGAISNILEANSYEVLIADIEDRGCTKADGELQEVGDFLESKKRGKDWDDDYDIITNPPFGIANEFIAHALREHAPEKMAMLLNLNFLCGHANEDRNFSMEEFPPSKVYVFKRRLPMMHRDGWDGPEAGSQMNIAWFVWEKRGKNPARPYGEKTELIRVDWKDYYNPEDGGESSQRTLSNSEAQALNHKKEVEA